MEDDETSSEEEQKDLLVDVQRSRGFPHPTSSALATLQKGDWVTLHSEIAELRVRIESVTNVIGIVWSVEPVLDDLKSQFDVGQRIQFSLFNISSIHRPVIIPDVNPF